MPSGWGVLRKTVTTGVCTHRLVTLMLCVCCWAPLSWAKPPEAPSSPANSSDTLILQLKWLHQFQFAGYYAALEKGFYRDAGLTVVLEQRSANRTPIDGLISGRAQFAVTDTGVLIYRSNNVPLVALAAVFQHSPSILLSRRASGIESLQDLKGKRVRMTTGYMNAELASMIESAGVDMQDIELMPGALSADGLIRGELDAVNAYITNEPRALAAHEVPYVVFHPRDYGVNFYGDILVTTEAQIAKDPEGVRKFRQASLRGWQYAIDHPEEVVDIILAKYNSQNKSREDLLFEARELIKLILADVVPVGYMNEERWQHIANVFKSQGTLQSQPDFKAFLYQPDRRQSFAEILLLYKAEASVLLFMLLALVLVFHILHLRTEVRARTQALQVAKEMAEEEARTDALTNLPNRRHFMKVLNRDISHAQRHGTGLVLMIIDIDFFKHVNDRFSHAAGDETLKMIGEVLSDSVRIGDLVARLGGEEFAITCPNTSAQEARLLADRLREKIEQRAIVYEGREIRLTISAGLASFEPKQTSEELLHYADLALYEAKGAGRNCVRVYHPPKHSGSATQLKSV